MPPWLTTFGPSTVAFLGALFGVWLGQKLSRDATQKRWELDQKLKVYSDILRTINEYSIWIGDKSDGIKFGSQVRREKTHTLGKQTKQIAEEFHATCSVVPIFLGDDTVNAIEKIKPIFFYHSDALIDLTPDSLDKALDALQEARGKIAQIARSDLRP